MSPEAQSIRPFELPALFREVPNRWAIEPLRNVAKFTTGWTPPTGDDSSYDGELLWANISDLKTKFIGDTAKTISDAAALRSRIAVSPIGSLLFSFKLSIGHVAIVSREMYTNEAIATFKDTKSLSMAFAYYALPIWLVQNANENIYGAKLLNAQLMRAAKIAVPPLDEQRQIAEYLDRETGKIDELITKQEQLVATLTERSQAEIYFAVTKGLDVHVPFKTSGVPWAGSIPNHWTVPRVAHGFVALLGKMVNEGRTESGVVIEAPYLRAGNVQPYGLDITEVKRMPFSEAELRSLEILRGDLIVVEGGQGGYGRSAIAKSDLRGWAFQNHVMRVRPTGIDRNRFLDYVLKTMRASGFIASLSSHASLPSFSADKLKSTRYPRPPVDEQDKIIDYLDSTTERIDQIVAKSAQTVEILRERRAALISAAVTGKIDVRRL